MDFELITQDFPAFQSLCDERLYEAIASLIDLATLIIGVNLATFSLLWRDKKVPTENGN
jgi:hypothetical protein